jgi:hypothetical protein
MPSAADAPWDTPALVLHARRMLDSYRHWTGRELLPREGSPLEQARALFQAPFVVVSHGTQADPVLNYGNATALALWEMPWAALTATPSRLTAEAPERAERARLMAEVTRNGFIANYRGVRISSSGKRFMIEQAIVWNLRDEKEQPCGQAATFSAWQTL